MIRNETRKQIAEQATQLTRRQLAEAHRCNIKTIDIILREQGKRAVPDKAGRPNVLKEQD